MLQVNNLTFQYKKQPPVLKNMNFTLQKGAHLCIMGESGCGKSTLLKVIYGLLDATNGTLFWNDVQVLGPAHHLVPGMEFFKYVPQNFDLMPYTSVAENISKYLSRFYPKEAQKRTQELLDVIEMSDFADVKVKTLSGGQQQRVAIAKALAKEPELLLLDEPFSQIDNFKKNSLRRKLFAYLKQKNIACIVATHDGNDALSFADDMIVIQNNTIIAHAHPKELYKNPKTTYVAALFDDVNVFTIDNKEFLLYPHQIKIDNQGNYTGVVKNAYFKGYYWLIEVDYNNQTLFVANSLEIKENTNILFSIIQHA